MAVYYFNEKGKLTTKKVEKKQGTAYVLNSNGKLEPKRVKSNLNSNMNNKESYVVNNDWLKIKDSTYDSWENFEKAGQASVIDSVVSLGEGVGGLLEGVVDLGAYVVSGGADFLGMSDTAKDIKNWAKEDRVGKLGKWARDTASDITGNNIEENSIYGNKTDAVFQGVGQVGGMIATGGIAGAAGAGAGTANAIVTGMNFASSTGRGMSEAYNEGASDKDAIHYGLMQGAIDTLSEKMFGGLGKASGLMGFSKGFSALDDTVATALTSKIKSKVGKTLVQYGVKAGAEGSEEVIAGALSAVAKKMTYKSKEDLLQLMEDEQLLDQFISGALVSGIAQSGDVVTSLASGRDFITNYTDNEQKVIDFELSRRISERESNGDKLTSKEKSKLKETVENDLKKGRISIDSIEEALGGESYSSYKLASDKEKGLKNKMDFLGAMKLEGKTLAERAQLQSDYDSAKAQYDEYIKAAYTKDAGATLASKVDSMTQKDAFIRESYNEKSRRSQTYTADVSKYAEGQRATIQSAIDSGILNNTTRTHEFVDMIARLSADKGVSFDFSNNQKIKDTGYAIEGKTVNGYVEGNKITLNINSAKALNKVVGHEITHVLEGTGLYSELQAAVKAYAESKGEYQSRLEDIKALYKDQNASIENELTADLVGDYLFTDEEFINNLSSEQPGIFRKIYEEIKYFIKIATAGTKEAKQLEKVKRAFDKVYKENRTVNKASLNRYDIDYDKLDDFLQQVEEKNGQTDYKYNQHQFSKVPKDVARMMYEATDGRVNAEDKYFAFEGGKLSHELKSHGDEKSEASKGQKNYTTEDVDKIITTMMEPDIVEDISSGDVRDQRNVVAFAKEFEGEMVVISAIGGKRNPNIVPEEILWFTKDKWDDFQLQGMTIKEIAYSNDKKRIIDRNDIEKIKKNRVTVVHDEVDASSARTSKTLPRSPLDLSISFLDKKSSDKGNLNNNYNIYGSDIAFDDDFPIASDLATPQEIDPKIRELAEALERQTEAAVDYEPDPDNFGQPIKTVADREAAKLENYKVELASKNKRRDTMQRQYNRDIAEEYDYISTLKDKNSVNAHAAMARIEALKTEMNNELADIDKSINTLKERIKKMSTPEYKRTVQRQQRQQELRTEISEIMGDTTNWKDKKSGMGYKLHTLKRNLRDVIGDTKKADTIYRYLQGNYNQNEAKLNTESSDIKKPYAEMNINKYEDQYIQMLGEYRYNPDTELRAEQLTEFMQKHKDKIDVEKVDKVIDMARDTYDDLFKRVNEVLKEYGIKEIPYREGYFPHFTKEPQGIIAKILNWNKEDNSIPTDIAGLTETFKPNKSYQSFSQRRTGDKTDYSFLKGLDMYTLGALDWIHHIGDIQRFRAFENEIRYRHSDAGVQESIKRIESSEEFADYDADELQNLIDGVYNEAKNPLNNLVQNIRTHTNLLAGKKNTMDRAVEENFNRNVYSVVKNASSRINANMVGGSISSALTNFIPITQSWSQVSPLSSLKAMRDTIKSTALDDGTIAKSAFLTNRLRKADNLSKTTWDKVSDKISFMMEAVDSFTSQTVWRSKYMENINNGMSESEAILNADEFAEGVMAGRSRGNMPVVFESKNPFTKIFTAFQLEVANQYDYMLKDMPTDMKNKTKGQMVKAYGTMFIGAYVYNALYSSLTGRDAAFDPIGIIGDLLADLFDDEEDKPGDIVMNIIDSIGDELPYVGGVIFDGGRIPMSSALPYGEGLYEMVKGTITDASDGNIDALTKEWLNPLWYLGMPAGGGQLKKTVEGLAMFDDDLPIAGSYTDKGKLRYSVDDNLASRIQAGLFGKWSSSNAQEYIEDGRTPLTDKQLNEYVELANTGMTMKEYWSYRDGLKGMTKQAEKMEYIASLKNVTTEQKNIMANYILERDEPVDITTYDEYNDWAEFDFAMTKPEEYQVARAVGGYSKYSTYKSAINKLEADKDKNGEPVSGSRKTKVIDYINALDISVEEKYVLYKSTYPADNTYNQQIVDYLRSNDEISTEQMKTILIKLGFTIDAHGNIYD